MSRPYSIAQTPFFGYGFRTFFFSGALWAATSMLIWALWVTGAGGYTLPYGAFAWHAHELIFGYAAAIVAGFLLTAIPNWTGRSPIQGYTLFLLWATWLTGRLAFLFADTIGYLAAALLDSLFLLVLVPIVTREIVAGRNFRNLRVVAIVGLLTLVNIGFHIEYLMHGYPGYSLRAAVSLFVMLLSVIGGRIIPAFTRNWLLKHGKRQKLPQPFNKIDILTLVCTAAALLLWTTAPLNALTGYTLLVVGGLHIWRLARWSSIQTAREPLVMILHVGYLFVGLGFLLVGASSFGVAAVDGPVISPQLALHAWTTGAIGILTLAVMTRATRGHAGFALTAPGSTRLIYLLIIAATLARLAPVVIPALTTGLHAVASIAWLGAFLLFAVCYAPMLLRAKITN